MSEYPGEILSAARWAVMGHGLAKDFGEERKERLVNDIAYCLLSEREWRSEWRAIEHASAVGKKRHLFWTRYGKAVIGFRIAGTDRVRADDGNLYIGTHFLPLPARPAASKANPAHTTPTVSEARG
jgi:hypothetical protein